MNPFRWDGMFHASQAARSFLTCLCSKENSSHGNVPLLSHPSKRHVISSLANFSRIQFIHARSIRNGTRSNAITTNAVICAELQSQASRQTINGCLQTNDQNQTERRGLSLRTMGRDRMRETHWKPPKCEKSSNKRCGPSRRKRELDTNWQCNAMWH